MKRKHKCFIDVAKEYYEMATPGKGNIDKEEGFDNEANQNELRIAKIIHNELGGDILLYNEKLTKDGSFTPDFKWNETLWDLKSPNKIKSIDKRIQKGIHQIKAIPGGIIIDVPNHIPFSELTSIINKRWKETGKKLFSSLDVIIIINNKIFKIIRYKN